MAMFNKSSGKKEPEPRRPAPARSSGGDVAISIIGPGMRVRGDLSTDGTVRIEGTIEGTIRAGTAVVLGKEGRIIGDVVTQDAIIGGHLQGSIVAEARLELQSTCVVDGEIRTRPEHMRLEEGAQFNGAIQMTDAPGAEPPRQLTPPREEAADASPQADLSPELSTGS